MQYEVGGTPVVSERPPDPLELSLYEEPKDHHRLQVDDPSGISSITSAAVESKRNGVLIRAWGLLLLPSDHHAECWGSDSKVPNPPR